MANRAIAISFLTVAPVADATVTLLRPHIDGDVFRSVRTERADFSLRWSMKGHMSSS
jgi:hypothetical protein